MELDNNVDRIFKEGFKNKLNTSDIEVTKVILAKEFLTLDLEVYINWNDLEELSNIYTNKIEPNLPNNIVINFTFKRHMSTRIINGIVTYEPAT